MKKTKFYMSCAASTMLAFALTACNAVQDNPGGAVENPAEQQIGIQSGDTLANVIDQLAVTTDNVIVEIPEGVDTVYTGEIKVLGKQLTITGSEGTVVVATAPIVVDNSLVIENVKVDASELTNALVLLNEELPTEGLNENGAAVVEQIAFNGVTVEGLAYQLFFANKKKYIVNKLAVENSVIAINGKNKKTVFDFNGCGLPVLLSINKSTIYANPSNAVNGGFYSTQGGSRFVELGVEENVISITNSTLYNIANGKPVSTLRQNSQAQQKYIVKNSIIADCGAKNNKFLISLNGRQKGKADNWDIDNNVIVYGGEVSLEENTIAGEINNPVLVAPEFKAPEEGNFRPTSPLFLNLSNRPGDPRWVGGVRAELDI